MVALQTYSKNVTVDENTPIPLNNVAVSKGCDIVKQGPATIQFNKCGAYEVCVDCVVSASEVGIVSIQLEQNGVLQPQGMSSNTIDATTDVRPMSFTTYVQVEHNNSNCCCTKPTVISIINTGSAATFNNINVKISRESC